MDGPDYIVSELLSELKKENERKDAQIKGLHKTLLKVIVGTLLAVIIVIGICFWYLNQYDYTSADTLNIEKSAEGFYAMVDSDGSIVGSDALVLGDGESNVSSDQN